MSSVQTTRQESGTVLNGANQQNYLQEVDI